MPAIERHACIIHVLYMEMAPVLSDGRGILLSYRWIITHAAEGSMSLAESIVIERITLLVLGVWAKALHLSSDKTA